MTIEANEVQTLAPSEIQRPAPTQQQQAPVQQSSDAPLSKEQTAAVSQLATMRAQAATMPDSPDRDRLHASIGKLAAFAVAGGPRPPDFMPELNQKQDLSGEHDAFAARLHESTATLTASEREHVVSAGKAYGLVPDASDLVAEFASQAGIDAAGADTLARRAAEVKAFDDAPLTDTDKATLRDQCARDFGGEEKMQEAAGLALAYLKSKGLDKWAEQYGGRLLADAATINTLAFRARLAGLDKKG